MNRTFVGLAGAALGTVMMASAAQAASFNFDFTGANDFGNAVGAPLSFTSGPITVTATAFYIPSGGSSFAAAALNQYATYGLGVCSGTEVPACSTNDPGNAQTDNFGGDEYVLFSFSGIVDPTSVTIRADYEGQDQDVSYWLRTGGGTDSLVGVSLSPGLANIGFGSRVDAPQAGCPAEPDPDNLCESGPTVVTIPGSSTVTDLLFGALLGDSNDYFKIRSLSIDYTPPSVAEPGSLAIFGAALFGLGLIGRRRNA